MKKYASIILSILLVVLVVTGCGAGKENTDPYSLNKKELSYAKQTLSAVDSFLSGKSTCDKANDQIDKIQKKLNTEANPSAKALVLSTDITLIKIDLSGVNGGTTTAKDELKADRDKLESYIQ